MSNTNDVEFSRRDFLKLAISTGAAIGIAVACFGAGIGTGYAISQALSKAVKVSPKVKTVIKYQVPKIRVGFIYIGPIGDYGWTFAHERGREYVSRYLGPILKEWKGKPQPIYIEKVFPESRVIEAIKTLVEEEGCNLIFTTSFGYMRYTWEMARKYPDVLFGHCSGYLTPETPLNVVEYFIDEYPAYYLCGIVGGAMTKTNKVGYVPAFLTPEVIRHINAFTIGVKEGAALVGKDPDSVEVIVAPPLGRWYYPEKAREEAEALIAEGCDVLAYTEDSPTVLEVAESYQKKGMKIWSFSHYSDMHVYGPHACLTGQLVNWGPMYEELVIRAYMVYLMHKYCETPLEEALKIWTQWPPERPRDYWWTMHRSHYVPLTLKDAFVPVKETPYGTIYEPINVVDIWLINPAVPENVKNYVLYKRKLIMENIVDPFGPPISIIKNGKIEKIVMKEIIDVEGKVRVEPGMRLSKDELYSMKWFVKGVVLPKGVSV